MDPRVAAAVPRSCTTGGSIVGAASFRSRRYDSSGGVATDRAPIVKSGGSAMTRTRISVAAAVLLFGVHEGAQAQWVQIGSGLHGGGSVQTRNTPAESGRVTQLSRAWDESQQKEILWLGASHGGLWKSFEDAPGHVAGWPVVTDNFPARTRWGPFSSTRSSIRAIRSASSSAPGRPGAPATASTPATMAGRPGAAAASSTPRT